jgi:pimeloyl-ACP methyl ester carboxylesterase
MRAKANGLELEYEITGDPNGKPLVLIMGWSAQLVHWPLEFRQKLAAKGFRVIAFDNRDVGLSTKLDSAGAPDIMGIYTGQAKAAYTLLDMVEDCVGLLDALNIKKAHVAGMSMGGMIAQLVAAQHPDRVLSLSAIMTTTGSPELPPPAPEVAQAMAVPMEGGVDAAAEWGVRLWSAIGSPEHDYTTPAERARLRGIAERSTHPIGIVRQMAAIAAMGDFRRFLKNIVAPTVVLHGAEDRLVAVAGGRDVAANIKGADLVIIPRMGHDIPDFAYDTLAENIAKVAAKAS